LCGIEFHILSIIWFLWNIKNVFDILGFVLFVMFVVVFGWILFGSLENCDKGKEKVHRTLDILSLMRFLRKLRISLNYLALVASLIFFMKLCFGLSYV